MANQHEHLEDWLRDAYAMERQAETMIDAQLKRVGHYPQLQDRLRLHLDDTLGQQALVEACLMRLGTSPSATKDLAARVAAYGQIASDMLADDEVVKTALAGYAFEQRRVHRARRGGARSRRRGNPRVLRANPAAGARHGRVVAAPSAGVDDRVPRPFGGRSHRCEAVTAGPPGGSLGMHFPASEMRAPNLPPACKKAALTRGETGCEPARAATARASRGWHGSCVTSGRRG